MSMKSRLATLEKQIPQPPEEKWPDFAIRCQGVPRSAYQIEKIRRLRLYAEDPRATKEQRESWLAWALCIEPALEFELERDRQMACPQCTWPLHQPADGGGHKCQRCGCPVHVHGDGHVTDARPDATLEETTA